MNGAEDFSPGSLQTNSSSSMGFVVSFLPRPFIDRYWQVVSSKRTRWCIGRSSIVCGVLTMGCHFTFDANHPGSQNHQQILNVWQWLKGWTDTMLSWGIFGCCSDELSVSSWPLQVRDKALNHGNNVRVHVTALHLELSFSERSCAAHGLCASGSMLLLLRLSLKSNII